MSKRYLLPFIVMAIAASLGSCNSSPTSSKIDNATPTPSQSPSMAELRARPAATPKAVTGKTINVTLYSSDTQCQELLPQKVSVPAEEPMTNAVGKIIEARDTADFSLSGYRVKVQNGVATVDLRLSPQSKRQIASLSSCEQFALFGSLRKTLTSNSQWKIKNVRFTEKGEEIVL
ncbi:sporulation/spore germination protein [Fortiea sp. LEGE XX443]|uniref:GerMN domain-containing protein n=1 Tax=Fortiea sp. LEGE XX443 TaxID=1828611 RepID=UPI0018828C45|nr:GerMN domain-containing protein [Fortiea sp. LEGE XX443]MBE9006959.1 sporulation/spore germination protein [Fortiea sp. LEGE XX443]